MMGIYQRGAHVKWIAYLLSGMCETGSFAHSLQGFTAIQTTS